MNTTKLPPYKHLPRVYRCKGFTIMYGVCKNHPTMWAANDTTDPKNDICEPSIAKARTAINNLLALRGSWK